MINPTFNPHSMKTKFAFTLFLFILISTATAQQMLHATIDSVKVTYLAVEQPTAAIINEGISGIPQATISLKTGSITVSKVYFKIRDAVTNSLLYQVDYGMENLPLLNNEGLILFKNEHNNTTLLISPGEPYALKPYNYEVITEDQLQNQQTVFSVIQ